MYTLDLESVKKIADIYNILNQLEIKGAKNVEIVYTALINLQQILQQLQEQEKIQEQVVVADNTKKENK